MSTTLLGEERPQPQDITVHDADGEGETDPGEDSNNSSDSSDSDSDDSDSDSEDEDEEVIARKLNEQLWEDIRRARADTVPPPPPAAYQRSPKEEAAFVTMKKVLAFAASDPLVHSTLSDTSIPGHAGLNVLEMLKKILDEGRITPQSAGPLSHVLVRLAKSEVLFSPLPVLSPQTLKRKRDENEEVNGSSEKQVTAPALIRAGSNVESEDDVSVQNIEQAPESVSLEKDGGQGDHNMEIDKNGD